MKSLPESLVDLLNIDYLKGVPSVGDVFASQNYVLNRKAYVRTTGNQHELDVVG